MIEISSDEFERVKPLGIYVVSSSGEEYLLIGGFQLRRSIVTDEKENEINQIVDGINILRTTTP
jgi:hypothetical protein